MQLNSRTYLNVILTVIAVLLLVLATQMPWRIGATSAAYGQDKPEVSRDYLAVNPSGDKVSAATESVAEANKEIARQIGEVAKALQSVSKSIENVALAQRQPR